MSSLSEVTSGCPNGQRMGFRFGLDDPTIPLKRKFRWLLKIANISSDDSSIRALPPRRGARPSLGWKEYEFQHLTETIHYPFKPEWKPIQLHLFDLRCNLNPIFDWVRYNQSLQGGGLYNPNDNSSGSGASQSTWTPVVDAGFKRKGELFLFDGCGNVLEDWIIEGCWPQNIEWGELDMDNNDVVTVDVTLRYDRAYLNNDTSMQPAPFQSGMVNPTLR